MAFTINNGNTNSTENRNSRLVQGGLTDTFTNRLGWWERRPLRRSDDDFNIIILGHEAARPDLISHRVYGKALYAWLVLQYNNIVDPEVELASGMRIVLPTKSRLILDIITRSEGGNPV